MPSRVQNGGQSGSEIDSNFCWGLYSDPILCSSPEAPTTIPFPVHTAQVRWIEASVVKPAYRSSPAWSFMVRRSPCLGDLGRSGRVEPLKAALT